MICAEFSLGNQKIGTKVGTIVRWHTKAQNLGKLKGFELSYADHRWPETGENSKKWDLGHKEYNRTWVRRMVGLNSNQVIKFANQIWFTKVLAILTIHNSAQGLGLQYNFSKISLALPMTYGWIHPNAHYYSVCRHSTISMMVIPYIHTR